MLLYMFLGASENRLQGVRTLVLACMCAMLERVCVCVCVCGVYVRVCVCVCKHMYVTLCVPSPDLDR